MTKPPSEHGKARYIPEWHVLLIVGFCFFAAGIISRIFTANPILNILLAATGAGIGVLMARMLAADAESRKSQNDTEEDAEISDISSHP